MGFTPAVIQKLTQLGFLTRTREANEGRIMRRFGARKEAAEMVLEIFVGADVHAFDRVVDPSQDHQNLEERMSQSDLRYLHQGTLKGEVSLYPRPPVRPVRESAA